MTRRSFGRNHGDDDLCSATAAGVGGSQNVEHRRRRGDLTARADHRADAVVDAQRRRAAYVPISIWWTGRSELSRSPPRKILSPAEAAAWVTVTLAVRRAGGIGGGSTCKSWYRTASP